MRLNLILTFIWGVIGIPLLIVNLSGRAMAGIEPGGNGLMIGLLATVLAAYNLLRWWASRAIARSRAKSLPTPEKRRVAGPTLEYNPEFDFSRPGPKTIGPSEDTPRPR